MYYKRLLKGETIPKQVRASNPDLHAYMKANDIKLKPGEKKPEPKNEAKK